MNPNGHDREQSARSREQIDFEMDKDWSHLSFMAQNVCNKALKRQRNENILSAVCVVLLCLTMAALVLVTLRP